MLIKKQRDAIKVRNARDLRRNKTPDLLTRIKTAVVIWVEMGNMWF